MSCETEVGSVSLLRYVLQPIVQYGLEMSGLENITHQSWAKLPTWTEVFEPAASSNRIPAVEVVRGKNDNSLGEKSHHSQTLCRQSQEALAAVDPDLPLPQE